MMRRRAAFLFAPVVLLSACDREPEPLAPVNGMAATVSAGNVGDSIPGEWIVVFGAAANAPNRASNSAMHALACASSPSGDCPRTTPASTPSFRIVRRCRLKNATQYSRPSGSTVRSHEHATYAAGSASFTNGWTGPGRRVTR